MNKDFLLNKTKFMNLEEKLAFILNLNDVIFSTSFSLEDQIILDLISKYNIKTEIFTIDTGRLFNEAYNLWQKNLEKYKIKIKTYYPDQRKLEKFISQNGINSFRKSKDLRLSCCYIRKIEPLYRALIGKKIWISGIRKIHSLDRSQKDYFEYDNNLKIIKFYPLLNMTDIEIRNYIKDNQIEYNKLYDIGFTSIGCSPCTRAGKDREGRWWWENDNKKECGIHQLNIIKIK